MPVATTEPFHLDAVNIPPSHVEMQDASGDESPVAQSPPSESRVQAEVEMRRIIDRINNDSDDDVAAADADFGNDVEDPSAAFEDPADAPPEKTVDDEEPPSPVIRGDGQAEKTHAAQEEDGDGRNAEVVVECSDASDEEGPSVVAAEHNVSKQLPSRKRVTPIKKKGPNKTASPSPSKKIGKATVDHGISKKALKKTDGKAKAVRPRASLQKKKAAASPPPTVSPEKPPTKESQIKEKPAAESGSPKKGVSTPKAGVSKPKKKLVKTSSKSGLSKAKVESKASGSANDGGAEAQKAGAKRVKSTASGGQQAVAKKAKVDGGKPPSPTSKKVKTPVKQSNGSAVVKGKDVSPPKAQPAKKGSVGKETKTPVKKGKVRKNAKPSEEEEKEKTKEVSAQSDGDEKSEAEEEYDADELLYTPKKGKIIGNLACSTRDTKVQTLLDRAVEKLGGYIVVGFGGDCDTPLSAYVLGNGTKRGWGVLRAVASGIPLVTEEWLHRSMAEGAWQDMAAYRSDKFGTSPRSLMMDRGTNRLLDGMRIKVMCKGKEMGKVRKMVQVCGGRLAEARMDVVVNDTGKLVDGVMNVTKQWLADSIEHGVAIDPEGYKIE